MSKYENAINDKFKKDKEAQFEELMDQWVRNFAPSNMSNSAKSFISGDVTIAAMEPLIKRPTSRDPLKPDHMLLMRAGEDLVVRVFYNFNNKVKFDSFVGLNLCAFGNTKEITSLEGVRDVHFSHVFTRGTGETVGVRVRATLVAFKVKNSHDQLSYDSSHGKWMDLIMDPYCDASSILNTSNTPDGKGRVGDYYEKEDLSLRDFSSYDKDNKDASIVFEEIERHLNRCTNDCEYFLRDKLGLS